MMFCIDLPPVFFCHFVPKASLIRYPYILKKASLLFLQTEIFTLFKTFISNYFSISSPNTPNACQPCLTFFMFFISINLNRDAAV